jgi:AraC-like DNA-binding protein
MVTSLAPLPFQVRASENHLEGAKRVFLELAREEGHTNAALPDLCLYRFSRPTPVHKAATFGVTLGVVFQGAKSFHINGADLTVDPAHLLVVTRETEHFSAATVASQERPFLGLGLCFGPERVARALLALAEAGGLPTRESIPAFVMPCDAPIANAIERLLSAVSDPIDRKLLAPLVIDEILFRLLRSDAAAAVRAGVGHPADAHRIIESMHFIRERHADKLTVEALARRAAMSASHYAHRFRAVARVSPMRYVREVRLDRARTLLLTGDARAGEVATHVGFESPAHFTREFKRRYGVPPSRYRPSESSAPREAI